MEAEGNRQQESEAKGQRKRATSLEPTANRIYRTADEVEEVVSRFESCAFAPEEFDHPAHLLVALCYLRESSEAEALTRMRAGLQRFIAHHRLSGVYNETITRFWIRRVRALLDGAARERPLADLANEVIARGGEGKLIFEYFSRERLSTEEAVNGWVEPDARPLDF